RRRTLFSTPSRATQSMPVAAEQTTCTEGRPGIALHAINARCMSRITSKNARVPAKHRLRHERTQTRVVDHGCTLAGARGWRASSLAKLGHYRLDRRLDRRRVFEFVYRGPVLD